MVTKKFIEVSVITRNPEHEIPGTLAGERAEQRQKVAELGLGQVIGRANGYICVKGADMTVAPFVPEEIGLEWETDENEFFGLPATLIADLIYS